MIFVPSPRNTSVEGAAELALAVVKEEARRRLSVGEADKQVRRLLCQPASVRVGVFAMNSTLVAQVR
jgi:hypothetical protein